LLTINLLVLISMEDVPPGVDLLARAIACTTTDY
jgi:hypothetical protein